MADNATTDKGPDDFVIPQKFLEQLEEFANGGFILLTFTRKGNPVIHHCFETKKDQLALESSLFSYANKLEADKFESEKKEAVEEDYEDDEEDEKAE